VKLLLDNGAEVEHQLESQSALHLALAHGALAGRADAATACLRLLISSEAAVDATDEMQRTPLHVAAALGLADAVEALCCADSVGETLRAVDRSGATSLAAAARGGHAACVRLLLSAGSENGGCAAGGCDMYGSNELHWGAFSGDVAVLQCLLAEQPDALSGRLGARDSRGRTPAQVAALRGLGAAAALLAGDGADAPPVASVVRNGPTLILAPPDCAEHRTAAVLARGAPEPPPENARRLDSLLHPAVGLLRSSEFADPRRCTLDEESNRAAALSDVLRVHEWAYFRRIQTAIRQVPDLPGVVGSLDGDTGVSAGSLRAALAAAGGVCEAVDRVLTGAARNAFCCVRPPGHHAGPFGPVSPNEPPGSGSHGFCLLNNVAIGAAYALSAHRGALLRVAIVDFDVHHGQGTQACVEAVVPGTVKLPFSTVAGEGQLRVPTCKPWLGDGDRRNIFFASVHGYGRGFYPGTGATVDTCAAPCAEELVEWEQDGVCDGPREAALEGHPVQGPRVLDVGMAGAGARRGRGEAWRRVWAGRVLPALHAFAPDLLLVSAGFDAHAKDDIQGPVNLGVTEPDYEWLTGQLVAIANSHCQGRLVSVLEGGYRVHGGPASAFGRSVAAHVRALCAPSQERFDAPAERAALVAFWDKRRAEQAQARVQAEQELAALQASMADGGAGVAPVLSDEPMEEAGARRKRQRAAVDYALLAEQLAAEQAQAQAAAAQAE